MRKKVMREGISAPNEEESLMRKKVMR